MSLADLTQAALARVAAAATAEDLEAIRVEVLGRKGTLAGLSKDFGKLTPQEPAQTGKGLNPAKLAPKKALAKPPRRL